MVISVFALVAVTIAFCVWVERLQRRCRSLARTREAWKTFALAEEAIFECDLDCDEATTDRERLQVERQRENAEEAVMDAGRTLYNLGEYPDAYGCSPFLPSDPRLHDWCRSHIR